MLLMFTYITVKDPWAEFHIGFVYCIPHLKTGGIKAHSCPQESVDKILLIHKGKSITVIAGQNVGDIVCGKSFCRLTLRQLL